MATNPSGINGALFDANASNSLGGLVSGIGVGTNSCIGPPVPTLVSMPGGLQVVQIGTSNTVAAQACGYPGKAMKFETAAADVAAGAAFPDTYVNRSAQTCKAGSSMFAVAP